MTPFQRTASHVAVSGLFILLAMPLVSCTENGGAPSTGQSSTTTQEVASSPQKAPAVWVSDPKGQHLVTSYKPGEKSEEGVSRVSYEIVPKEDYRLSKGDFGGLIVPSSDVVVFDGDELLEYFDPERSLRFQDGHGLPGFAVQARPGALPPNATNIIIVREKDGSLIFSNLGDPISREYLKSRRVEYGAFSLSEEVSEMSVSEVASILDGLVDDKKVLERLLDSDASQYRESALDNLSPGQIFALGEEGFAKSKTTLEKLAFDITVERQLEINLMMVLALFGDRSFDILEEMTSLRTVDVRHFGGGTHELVAFLAIRSALDFLPEYEKGAKLAELLTSDNPWIVGSAVMEGHYYPGVLKHFLEDVFPTLPPVLKRAAQVPLCDKSFYPRNSEMFTSLIDEEIIGTSCFGSDKKAKNNYQKYFGSYEGVDFYRHRMPYYESPIVYISARKGGKALEWPGQAILKLWHPGGDSWESSGRATSFASGPIVPLAKDKLLFIRQVGRSAKVEIVTINEGGIEIDLLGDFVAPVIYFEENIFHAKENEWTNLYRFDLEREEGAIDTIGPKVGWSNHNEWGSHRISPPFAFDDEEGIYVEGVESKKFPWPFKLVPLESLGVEELESVKAATVAFVRDFIKGEDINDEWDSEWNGSVSAPKWKDFSPLENYKLCAPKEVGKQGVLRLECGLGDDEGSKAIVIEARVMRAGNEELLPFLDKIEMFKRDDARGWIKTDENDSLKGGFKGDDLNNFRSNRG